LLWNTLASADEVTFAYKKEVTLAFAGGVTLAFAGFLFPHTTLDEIWIEN